MHKKTEISRKKIKIWGYIYFKTKRVDLFRSTDTHKEEISRQQKRDDHWMQVEPGLDFKYSKEEANVKQNSKYL